MILLNDKDKVRTFEERQLATFQHEPLEQIVWQPRFSDWYAQNHIYELKKTMNEEELAKYNLRCTDLPRDIFGMEHVEIYDYLNASPRYPGECWPSMGFFSIVPNPNAEIGHKYYTDDEGITHHKITTPYGTISESRKPDSSYPVERILKTRDDFKPVLYYLENSAMKMEFNQVMYEIFREENEGRCVAVAGPWRSPYNKCIVELAGTYNTMVLMGRYRDEFDRFCAELERINLEIILPAILDSPVDFVTFGDNVDCRNNPPPAYKKYLQPHFEKAADMCRKAGKFSFAHYDGNLIDILPFLADDVFPFDGIEAPTFHPQGDVSIQEFKRVWGDEHIILDGIPSTIFLQQFTKKQFVTLVNEVLETFSPNIILGVSDEYSPNGLFSRMELISEIVADFHVD